jgi:O-methyltransferase
MKIENFISVVKPYTMTSIDRIKSLYNSLEYIRLNNIEGDIVECGVWKGGNILGCLEYLNFFNIKKTIWLYDTFSGMSESTNLDFDLNGVSGKKWESKCECSLEEVQKIINKEKYQNYEIKFVVGDINKTLL